MQAMEVQGLVDIANNVSIVFLLIIAVWWFNKQLEKANAKNDKLNDRVSEMEKNYITTIDRNTAVIEKITEAIEDLKNEIKSHKS